MIILELKHDNTKTIGTNITKMLTIMLFFIVGLATFGTNIQTAEAQTVLPAIRMGQTYKNPATSSATTKYKYLLQGGGGGGYLPQFNELDSKHGVKNFGWNLNSPSRGAKLSGGDWGGRTMVHSIYPNDTKLITQNGRTVLRITGTAVFPEYFHHTEANHKVAILTKEDKPSAKVNLWSARLLDQTSSASFDYGYGIVGGENDPGANVNVPYGIGNTYVHATNDPFPHVSEKVYNRSNTNTNKYFDRGNINLKDNNYGSWVNRNQVSNLTGLGRIGSSLTLGSTYVYDYTGFTVDIPMNALLGDGNNKTSFEFQIVMTMTTPNGQRARVMSQPLGIPGMNSSTGVVVNEVNGGVGDVKIGLSNINNIIYNPYNDALRNIRIGDSTRKSGTIRANHNGNGSRRYTDFTYTEKDPIMIGATSNLPRFTDSVRAYLNTPTGRKTAEFVEMNHKGRGDMWVGWSIPSITNRTKIYTTASLAYDTMPTARLTYTPRNANHKPIIVRHVQVENNDYSRPGQVMETESYSREKGNGGITLKPMTTAQLRSYGSNLRYTGRYRVGVDALKPTLQATDSVYYNNNQLFSNANNGNKTMYIDFYYTGNYVPQDTLEPRLDLRERHRSVGGAHNESFRSVNHKVEIGESIAVSRQRPFGYVYSSPGGYYEIDNKNPVWENVYTVRNTRQGNWHQWLVFYYGLRYMDYEIEHRNINTNNKIVHSVTGEVDLKGRDRSGNPIGTARPRNIAGYNYANRFSVNGGNRQAGSSYTIKYDDNANSLRLVFYYDFVEPEISTKRIQGDTTGTITPMDIYTNAGLVTERDLDGNVVVSNIEANTSGILDKYESPIAIAPQEVVLNVLSSSGNVLSRRSTSNTRIYNNEYLDSLRVDGRIGHSTSANGTNSTVIRVVNGSGHERASRNMSLGSVDNIRSVQEEGLGISNGTIGVNEDRNYVGRWLDTQERPMSRWSPEGLLGTRAIYTGNINDATDVRADFTVRVYNRMKHNYTPRLGTDGLEYHEYTGTEVLPGYYRYNTSGNRTNTLVQSDVVQRSNLDIRDIKTEEYVDTEGYRVGRGEIAPTQHQVASERFDHGGQTVTGFRTDTVNATNAPDVIVSKADSTYRVTLHASTPEFNYYEEFGYAPYHVEDEVMTQQAVPVGGKVAYVNPYQYSMLPSYYGTSVMERSGYNVDEIETYANDFIARNGFSNLNSEVEFNSEHSGFYMSDKDEFETFAMADVLAGDRDYMQNALATTRQHNPEKLNPTVNYMNYNSNVINNSSRYQTAGVLESAGRYNYKQPIAYAHGINEFMLEDVVAVGRDTGFPVTAPYNRIQEDYNTNYEREFGVAPSDTDELITTNKGSMYLLPLNKQGQSLDDIYYTRLFVNGIGLSQINLVDDSNLEFENYLYGRGDNVIYTGNREEVESGETFNVDQTVGQDAKAEELTKTNGVRTNNNSEINDKVLDDE